MTDDDEKLIDAILDALERIGNGQDYYKINHAGAAKLAQLRRFIRFWLMTL